VPQQLPGPGRGHTLFTCTCSCRLVCRGSLILYGAHNTLAAQPAAAPNADMRAFLTPHTSSAWNTSANWPAGSGCMTRLRGCCVPTTSRTWEGSYLMQDLGRVLSHAYLGCSHLWLFAALHPGCRERPYDPLTGLLRPNNFQDLGEALVSSDSAPA
jgi:hypothetical protein